MILTTIAISAQLLHCTAQVHVPNRLLRSLSSTERHRSMETNVTHACETYHSLPWNRTQFAKSSIIQCAIYLPVVLVTMTTVVPGSTAAVAAGSTAVGSTSPLTLMPIEHPLASSLPDAIAASDSKLVLRSIANDSQTAGRSVT